MHEINKVLSAAAMRMAIANFFKGLVYVAAAIVLGLILARVVEQVFALTFAWKIIAHSAAGAAVLGSIVWAIATRPSKAAVARRVDEGANLKEVLSTALSIEKFQNEDPWARVTVESAVRQARGVRVSHAVPIGAPRFWPVPFALALALAIVWIAFPRMDVFGWRATKVAEEKKTLEIKQVKAEAIEAKKKIEEMSDKLGLEKDPVEPPTADKPEPRDPEAIRRSAIKDLTKLQDRIDQLRNGEKGQKLDAIQNKLKDIRSPGKETSELAKAMANSNFQQAQKEIEKMKEQMAAGSSNEKQKQDMAEQMNELSKQLSEIAKNKEQLEKAMQNAGLDPKKAADPEAMKKAMEAAQNMTPEQKQQLQQMAQAMSQSQSAMDAMSKAASQMAQAGKEGDKEGMQQAAQQMQQQMNQMEQLKQEMDLADAAKSECQSKMAGMCNKPGDGEKDGQQAGMGQKPGDCNKSGNGKSNPNAEWSASWCNGQGNRMDGPRRGGGGVGKGGQGDSAQADFTHEKKKDMGIKGDGPTVSQRLVEGDSIKGESRAEFVAAVSKADQGASDAMENMTIPREFHGAIKNYFGSLKKKGGDAAKDAAPEAPAAPAKPVEDAKDAGK
jgi:chemotaxis protein histidine kinase CheA